MKICNTEVVLLKNKPLSRSEREAGAQDTGQHASQAITRFS